MSRPRASPLAILREDVGGNPATLIASGLMTLALGILGLLVVYGGSDARDGWRMLLFAGVFGLPTIVSLQALCRRKSFMVDPDGITFREHIEGKAVDRHVPWSNIGYFQVISHGRDSAIYWAPASSPRPPSHDQRIYDLEFPDRCAIGKWPIPHEELAALLNAAHLRWRKEPA